MEKNSRPKSDFLTRLEDYLKKGWISAKSKEHLLQFYDSYEQALELQGISISKYESVFNTLLELLKNEILKPHSFAPYHVQIRSPFDHYQFGLDFVRPLVDMQLSSVQGLEHLNQIASKIRAKDNVILLANHQTEADPQAISILLEGSHPDIASEIIFVAGERVITDPLAIPFSMGHNLLCIFSKRYIDHPPEEKSNKQLHNKRTMQLMSELLGEGGKCIYVAPSGGRDRQNAQGVVEVAPFDPQSLEMFYLMAQRAGHPTHFYPLALSTYDLLPPPQTVQVELGEARHAKRAGIHLAFGPEIDMEHFPGCDEKDKHKRRQTRADYIWNLVKKDYKQFSSR